MNPDIVKLEDGENFFPFAKDDSVPSVPIFSVARAASISFGNAARSSFEFIGNGEHSVRIASDGFYVRGVKLEQDETEARRLFDAFTEYFSSQGCLR